MKQLETIEEALNRFMSKVVKEASGCWRWTAHFRENGYGGFRFRGVSGTAHRASFILFRDEITAGQFIRHLCHNKWCVNPKHLAIGTPADNSRDCVKADRRKQDYCKKGMHRLTGSNIKIDKRGRRCRACNREYGREATKKYRLRKLGLLTPSIKKTAVERFLSFVKKGNNKTGCWKWIGNIQDHGYGTFHCKNADFKGNSMRSHRASYLLFKGAIPKGKLVRHLCNNKICVNPDHLELGTPADNSRDYKEAGYGRKQYCKSNRHKLIGKNLYIDPNGGRHCKACEKLRMQTATLTIICHRFKDNLSPIINS